MRTTIAVAIVASALIASPAFAFNPQPDPPGKVQHDNHPNTVTNKNTTNSNPATTPTTAPNTVTPKGDNAGMAIPRGGPIGGTSTGH